MPSPAQARIWCAEPVWVHEWGVQRFDAQGRAQATGSPAIPSWFHRAAASTPVRAPVRHLPIDTGERSLPVLHFYVRPERRDVSIPIGIEVGFTHGEASAWYPQVDARRRRAETHTAEALTAHRRLLEMRAQESNNLPRDPTHQLFWDRLELSSAPRHTPQNSSEAWVRDARNFGALWANGSQESERFIFYEAATEEQSAIVIVRGPTWGAGRRHLILRNRSAYDVHDVFLTHTERVRGALRTYAIVVPTIPAGADAGYLLEDHQVTDLATTPLRARLRARLIDGQEPTVPRGFDTFSDCVMGRNPGHPQRRTEGHRLYAAEVDLLLDAWAPHFFPRQGTRLVYRESTTYLDAAMPLSLFTDMRHYIRLRRLGLAVQAVQLP